MRAVGWHGLLLPGLLALSGCTLLLPTKSAEHIATVQFMSSGSDSECAILRAHGDEVVLLFLNSRPRLEGLPEFLTRRGLSRVSDTVFLANPAALPDFPGGVDWGTVWCSEAALPSLEQVAWRGGAPPLRVVRQEERLEIPGVLIRLLPTPPAERGGGRLLADVRHSGNRIVLTAVPDAQFDLEVAAAESPPIDLAGLLPPAKVKALRLLPGLKDSRLLVQGEIGQPDDRGTYVLSERKRLLFQSNDEGLESLGQAQDYDQ